METVDPNEQQQDDEQQERIVTPDEHVPGEGDDKGEPDDDVREAFAHDESEQSDAAATDTDTEP